MQIGLILGIGILCLVGVLVLARLERPLGAGWPVYAKPLMSEVELKLYGLLLHAVPDLRIFPQVQLCRFIEVQSARNRYAVLNRFDRLSADFVLARSDGTVACVIELDDASHARQAARERDAKKEAVLAAAGIPLLRLRAGRLPSVTELAIAIRDARERTKGVPSTRKVVSLG